MQKTRVIRAKVVSDHPVTVLYLDRARFFQFMKDEEIGKYYDTAQPYTDFSKEGCDMINELKRSKMLCNNF